MTSGVTEVDHIDAAQIAGKRIEIGQSPSGPVCSTTMAVEAQDQSQELGPIAAHHRQNHDQRADAQRDAEQRERRDHRDEALLAPRAEVAIRRSNSVARRRRTSTGEAHRATA